MRQIALPDVLVAKVALSQLREKYTVKIATSAPGAPAPFTAPVPFVSTAVVTPAPSLMPSTECAVLAVPKRTSADCRSCSAGQWVNDQFLACQQKISRNSRRSFHSFRHTFITAASRTGLSEQVVAQIAGHARGSTAFMARYRKDEEASFLKKHIDRISFDIGKLAPSDLEAGVSSVKDAWAGKERAAKRAKPAVQGDS